jgi:hypothetical protein
MNLDHLIPAVQARAMLGKEERIIEMRKPVWLPYPAAEKILEMLEDMLAWPHRSRMPNLLLVGPTNNGKTTILEEFVSRHPPDPMAEADASVVPVLMVKAPPTPDEKAFYVSILMHFATPITRTGSAHDKRLQACALMAQTKVKMVIIDEIQDILAGDMKRHRAMLNAIKSLGNALKIPIVAAGTEPALNAVNVDPQISNRFHPAYLLRWLPNESFFELLKNFEAVLPLREPSRLHECALARKIHEMSEGILGEVELILSRAAIHALKNGKERIDIRTLESIDWVRPSLRAKMCQRKAS